MIRQEPSRVTEARAFDRHRPLLFSIAYRMLGSVMDAEDAVQEACLRWRGAEGEIRSSEGYLSTVVTRLSIDRLRSAKARRERYVGLWLPEPLATGEDADVAEAPVVGETLSMAFLVLLESLNPVERAVFLLREVFDYDYAEISSIVGKSEANCRQIARGARQAVAARRPRFESSESQQERMTRLFVEACAGGTCRVCSRCSLRTWFSTRTAGARPSRRASRSTGRTGSPACCWDWPARELPGSPTSASWGSTAASASSVTRGSSNQRYYPRDLRRADTDRPQRAKPGQAARRAYHERDQDERGKVKTRMLMAAVVPYGYQAMVGLERWTASAGLDKRLHDLIRIRASQINGCAFCIDLHTRDARRLGEEEARIYALDAWREYPFFSREERAALALTEAVTLLSETRVPDDVWELAEHVFGDEYLAKVLMAIVTINAWNRIAVSTRMAPEAPQP